MSQTGNLQIEPNDAESSGPCPCCGDSTRTVSGFLYDDGFARAAYYVQWTLGGVSSHGAAFDFIVGSWGEGTTAADRVAVAVEFQRTSRGPAFMIRDAAGRPVGASPLVSRAMRREEVLGTELAMEVFSMLDAVWLKDSRIVEVSSDAA